MNVAGHPVTIVTDSLTDGAVPAPPVRLACKCAVSARLPATPVVVTAGEIRTNCSDSGDRPLMQAPVEAESSTSVTLLGFPINVSNPTDTPQVGERQWPGVPTLDAFLNAVTPRNDQRGRRLRSRNAREGELQQRSQHHKTGRARAVTRGPQMGGSATNRGRSRRALGFPHRSSLRRYTRRLPRRLVKNFTSSGFTT